MHIIENMKGYIDNVEQRALQNNYFREVLYTDERLQLVVMSLAPREDIGEEVHTLDQFIRVEKGEGKSVLDGVEHVLNDGFAVIIPAGTRHNIINTSSTEPMKLYTLYAPPNHAPGTIHKTKAEAQVDEEHYGG
jgi:mannose-6-phosphate isomerase-like protein (cupin superfamily)